MTQDTLTTLRAALDALDGLLKKIQAEAPHFSGKLMGFSEGAADNLRNLIAAMEDAEPVAFVITDENINHLQVASLRKLVERCKHAHHTDLIIRINGKDEHYEADWIKHLEATSAQPVEQPAMKTEHIGGARWGWEGEYNRGWNDALQAIRSKQA